MQLLLSAAGLYASFLTWGFMQEKITGNDYENAEGLKARWKFSYVLNACMALNGVALGAVAYTVESKWSTPPKAGAPKRVLPSPVVYLKPALSNTLASPIGYMALSYINFPMMLLAKSCKLIPVMIMGSILNGDR